MRDKCLIDLMSEIIYHREMLHKIIYYTFKIHVRLIADMCNNYKMRLFTYTGKTYKN